MFLWVRRVQPVAPSRMSWARLSQRTGAGTNAQGHLPVLCGLFEGLRRVRSVRDPRHAVSPFHFPFCLVLVYAFLSVFSNFLYIGNAVYMRQYASHRLTRVTKMTTKLNPVTSRTYCGVCRALLMCSAAPVEHRDWMHRRAMIMKIMFLDTMVRVQLYTFVAGRF